MAVLTIASFLSTVAFYFVRYSLYFNIGGDHKRDGGSLLLVWLISIVVWVISFLLLRALSRYREYSADRGSAIITGQPSDLASALMKISGLMDQSPQGRLEENGRNECLFHYPCYLWCFYHESFSTHPSVEKRIARLEKMQQEMR